LDSKGKPTDARAVAEALRGYGKAVPCLVEAVDLFLAERAKKIRPDNAPEWDKSGYSKATVKKYRSRFGLLTEYLKKQQVPYMPLAKFTARHADALVSMITTRKAAPGKHAGRSRGQGGAQYAAKVVGLVSQVLDYAVNQEWLAVNPLASWATPHGFDKPLIYLLPEQVAQLEGYRFASDYLQRVVDSFLFSCWTGLAWSDYDNLDVNKHLSEGWLSMLRTKTGTSFSLPLLPGAERLLIKYGAEGLPRYENAPLNRALKEIAAVLGWPLELQQELSHHAARRTFGMFLLNEDVPLATVSAVLGHRNQRTTERYYAKFIEKRKVERDFAGLRERLSNRPSPAPVQSSALPTRPQPARFQPRVVPVVPLWAEPATPARKEVASA
jgi:site-specific recombinase XerD